MPLPRPVILFIVPVIALTACSLDVQQPAPASGPSPASFSPGVPPAWFGGSARSDLYQVGIDLGVSRAGRASGYLRSRTNAVDSTSFATLGQTISAVAYRGRRVRMSGFVRVDSLSGGGAGLWMRIDGPTGVLGFDNMTGFGRAITGTGWRWGRGSPRRRARRWKEWRPQVPR